MLGIRAFNNQPVQITYLLSVLATSLAPSISVTAIARVEEVVGGSGIGVREASDVEVTEVEVTKMREIS